MPDFFPLEVTDIRPETREAVVVTLKARPEDVAKFTYEQGQYLTFKKTFEGEELRRSYSICASVNDNELRVGIKKVNGGWFSTWANEELAVGDVLETMPPMGNFNTALSKDKPKNYLLFAVGSGITPILSLAKTILEAEPASRIILTYFNRSFNTIMFREALSDLKDRFITRFSVLHMLKHDAGDIDLLTGRIDADKCDQLFTRWMSPEHTDTAFICGPKEVMFMISDRLQVHGMDKDKIKFELFASAPPKKARAKAEIDADKNDVVVTLIQDGQSRRLEMSRHSGQSVLDAALAANIELPYACQAGVCSTCMCQVKSGEVEMQSNYALEDYEVQRGVVLSCQSIPLTKELTLSFDEMTHAAEDR